MSTFKGQRQTPILEVMGGMDYLGIFRLYKQCHNKDSLKSLGISLTIYYVKETSLAGDKWKSDLMKS